MGSFLTVDLQEKTGPNKMFWLDAKERRALFICTMMDKKIPTLEHHIWGHTKVLLEKS